MQNHTHICFLDNKLINLVTPLLDTHIPSNEVIVFVEQTKLAKLDAIRAVLNPRGISLNFKVMPQTRNTEELVSYFHQEIDSLVTHNHKTLYAFNASCGDRQHVLAMYEVVRAYEFECFMVEPNSDELHWLVPSERKNTQLADKLKIRDFFALIDSQINNIANTGNVDIRYRKLGAKWAASQDNLGQALGNLNYLAASSDNAHLTSAVLNRSQLNCADLQTLIDDLEDAELVCRKNDRLVFINEEARFFANGGWLEEYVYGLLLSLKKEVPHIQDIAQGVEITRKIGQGTVVNELDIVIMANNKLHLIECKTKKFDKGEGNQVIYKLDSLTDLLGGIQARAALISYKGIRTHEQLRAKELEIELFSENELAQLREKLKTWLTQA